MKKYSLILFFRIRVRIRSIEFTVILVLDYTLNFYIYKYERENT